MKRQLPEVLYKRRCSNKFCKIHRKTPVLEPLFNKVTGLTPARETPRRMFSCDFLKFFKNTFFTEHFRATASDNGMEYPPLQVAVLLGAK